MKLPNIVESISRSLNEVGARAILVGGAVRDHFLGTAIKDYDIEVYGLERLEELETILSQFGKVDQVGKSFGVLKFRYEGEEYDFSFPRTEKKSGIGHCGFDVRCDGNLSFVEASRRRDFTINAMGYDIYQRIFIDPHNGLMDIKHKVLRHIDDQSFIEDPLRVYRAVQFAARFEYRLDNKTFALCALMVENGMLEELPQERIYMEFQKLLLKASRPSIGLELMRSLGVLRYFPELEALIGIPQSNKWHPEGDVWTHTLMSIDVMAKLKTGQSKQDLKLMLAVLCHDFGKATHTQVTAEKITAIGHAKAGIAPTKSFLYRLTNEHDFIKSILPLVEHHSKPSIYCRNQAKDKTIRKLSTLVNIEELATVAKADALGRATKEAKEGIYLAGEWLLDKAKALSVNKEPPIPLLQGRDLIALGLKPSKAFKKLLNESYNAQLSGKITTKDEALVYIRNLLEID